MLSRPTPEYFLERAKALAAEGPAHWEQALRGLDDAVEQLGPLVTLQQLAIDLEVNLRRYSNALERLNTIARWLPAERRLARRGEILLNAGRTEEAQKDFSDALAHIETLNPGRRQSKPMQKLVAQLREKGVETPKENR